MLPLWSSNVRKIGWRPFYCLQLLPTRKWILLIFRLSLRVRLLLHFPGLGPPDHFRPGLCLCPVYVKRLTGSLGLGTGSTGRRMTKKLSKGTKFKWKIYGKFWGIQSIPKSAHLSHGLSPPTAGTPISFANSSCHWHASGVSWGKYWIHCLLVRGGRSIKFMSSSEGGLEGKKVFVQFLRRCCSTAATWSAFNRCARSLWRSFSFLRVSFSSAFQHCPTICLYDYGRIIIQGRPLSTPWSHQRL